MNEEGSILRKTITGNPLYDLELERAPWEIKDDHFGRIDSRELIAKSLAVIKKDNVLLVLASLDGRRYGNTILMDFDRDGLTIERPNNFEKSIDRFRIYFKDILGVWSFFQVQTGAVSEDEDALVATFPEAMHCLQTRQYQRVAVPEGTRADFWENDQRRSGGLVKDISAGGMLIYTGSTDEQFRLGTIINDIAITLPAGAAPTRKSGSPRTALPVIKKGRIVRTFRDRVDNQVCHGVAFEAEGESEGELARYIEIIKDMMLGNG